MDSGVLLTTDYGPGGPTYLFSGLNDIKPAMIAEATAAAREAAQQFARDANASVGGLRRANQGCSRSWPGTRHRGFLSNSSR